MKERMIKVVAGLFGPTFIHVLHSFYKQLKPTKIPPAEVKYIERAARYIPSGAVALDVGANIGVWTEFMAKQVGPGGKILAFEPLPETFRFLDKKYGHLGNVQIFNLALSDTRGQKKIMIDEMFFAPSTAAITDTANHIQNKSKLKEVPIVTERLDDLLGNKGIREIKFMKIDVEGHEQQVLMGGASSIRASMPVIFMEILREKWVEADSSRSPSAALLLSWGYRMGQFSDQGVVFDKNLFDPKTENFLFLPQGAIV